MRLWALAERSAILEEVTVGVGHGTRFAHLNRLLVDVESDRWVVAVDDDVCFLAPRPFQTMLAVARTQGFDLSQPTHARGSYRSHDITKQERRNSVRETTFVEIGPVLIISPRIRPRLLPFPEEGMGWGVELEWSALRQDGFRLGMLDCVPMLHLDPPAAAYDRAREDATVALHLRAHGFSSYVEAQRTLRRRRFA